MNEVYEGEVTGFVKRGDKFFGLMPNGATTVELSERSPLRPVKETAYDRQLTS